MEVFKVIQPSPLLAPYVKNYWLLKTAGDSPGLARTVLTGMMSLIFHRGNPELVERQPWYQGDHSLFLQQGRPAIAVSSEWFIENMECQEITHTPKDNLTIVRYERVAECALGVAKLISKL